MTTKRATVWTLGHSTRAVETLIQILHSVPIDQLVDVRSVPQSRYNPQFNSDALAWALELQGVAYRHEPQLGGLRKPTPDSIHTALTEPGFRGYADHMQTAGFETAIQRLLLEAQTQPIALMCAEALPWHCHRAFLSDALVARGVAVQHLLDGTRNEAHQINPLARVREGRVSYPGLL